MRMPRTTTEVTTLVTTVGMVLGLMYVVRLQVLVPTQPPTSPSGPRSLAETLVAATVRASHKQMVLLITDARSGSSYTAELVAANPKVFFWFEPSVGLAKSWKQWVDESMSTKAIQWLEPYLLCDPRRASTKFNRVFVRRADTAPFSGCFRNHNFTGHDHLRCYNNMTRDCNSHDVIFMKTVRFRLRWSQKLLDSYPNLKVLFLIRDPRATLSSQYRVLNRFYWSEDFTRPSMAPNRDYISWHCSNLTADVRSARGLRQLYPRRVKVLRYEDGALDPPAFTRDIYNFLDLELTSDIERHIDSLSNSSARMTPFNMVRHDGKAVINKWRERESFSFAQFVDSKCSELYPSLGYSTVMSQDDLRSSRTLVQKPQSDDLGIGS